MNNVSINNNINRNSMSDRYNQAISVLNQNIYQLLIKIPNNIKNTIQEIRLRVNKPIMLYSNDKIYYLTNDSSITTTISNIVVTSSQKDIMECFKNICSYSVYSHQRELTEGYIVIKGGHRIGLCGTAVINNGAVTGIKDISSLNIRIAREISGSANKIIELLGYSEIIKGLLIIGTPSSGKTTILRDLSRQLSLDAHFKVVVIDERGEIGSVWCGINQNDNGFSDILDGYPKGQGIIQAIRVLSPDVIICDEVGTVEEISAIEQGLNSGVGIITTAHASSINDIRSRKQIQMLLSTGAFSNIVMLKNRNTPCQIENILTKEEVINETNRSIFNYGFKSNTWINGFKKA